MEQLSLALKTRVPCVAVKTDDIVFFVEVLSALAGEDVRPLSLSGEGNSPDISGPGKVLFTNSEVLDAKLWLQLKKAGKTLVCVNTKKSVLPLDCGMLYPPINLLRQKLGEWMIELDYPEGNARELAQAFGGLTLKEAFEVLKMTIKSKKESTPNAVNEVRQGLTSKAKGITQVNTQSEYYQAPWYLSDWMGLNAQFFLEPPHPSLMPRGLLFDGPPGTGKTAGAKHIANELGLPLYRVDIGGMKGKYVGDSEGALMAALTQLDQAAPCVALLDEVEKIFNDSGDKGVTSSMLGSLLWWLQEHKTQVFTVMTTNQKGAIPKELFRDRRLDGVLTFNGLETMEEVMDFSTNVWDKMAEKVGLSPAASLLAIVSDCGADLVNGPIPQAKVEQQVYSMIKQELAKKVKGAKNV